MCHVLTKLHLWLPMSFELPLRPRVRGNHLPLSQPPYSAQIKRAASAGAGPAYPKRECSATLRAHRIRGGPTYSGPRPSRVRRRRVSLPPRFLGQAASVALLKRLRKCFRGGVRRQVDEALRIRFDGRRKRRRDRLGLRLKGFGSPARVRIDEGSSQPGNGRCRLLPGCCRSLDRTA